MGSETTLPAPEEMYRALCDRDSAYEGIFVAAIRTTGIFCRPTCNARKPLEQNIEYFQDPREALLAGYRPCKRCRPIEPRGATPDWIRPLLDEVEKDPARRWKDRDLRAMEIDPGRVRRWFQSAHGMTFHAYQRARRLGLALGRIRHGDDLTDTAYEHGFESVSGFREAFANRFGNSPGRSRGSRIISTTRLLTPLGPMVAAATDEGICLLEFADRRMLETQLGRIKRYFGCEVTPGRHAHFERLDRELSRYFAGELEKFTVPIVYPGTSFQIAVWEYLRTIPYGAVRSYSELAQGVGNPAAVRAVGRANGDNRLAIIVPCHRVLGADRRLTGYGGGLWRKQFLLDLEGASVQQAITMEATAG
jgi:AraC family transcriptional regulator, regulatory protein of adaptative response / methylated-DNA-[protein]-cysteine methyltransferase